MKYIEEMPIKRMGGLHQPFATVELPDSGLSDATAEITIGIPPTVIYVKASNGRRFEVSLYNWLQEEVLPEIQRQLAAGQS